MTGKCNPNQYLFFLRFLLGDSKCKKKAIAFTNMNASTNMFAIYDRIRLQ